MARDQNSISSREAGKLGLPDGWKSFTPFPFGSMDQQSSRVAIAESDFYFRENFIRIGNGKLRTLWDRGTPIYTAPSDKSIISFYFYNIGPTNYAIIFLNDGTGYQINTATLMQTTVSSTPSTFWQVATDPFPACCQWGTNYLLIASPVNANSYWVWDGSVLYTSGTIGPIITITNSGTGFTSAPSVTFSGGGGSGAAATAYISSAGSIVLIIVTNSGTGYTSAPTVGFSGGGGSSATATATIMPTGVSGSFIETFQQRVWVGNGFNPTTQDVSGDFQVSAPGSFIDFSSADGGLQYTSTDPFLRYQYTNMRQSNGYLYPFGDSSIDVISNVQTSGDPLETTFNYQNTDPQTGTIWRDSITDFSRTLLFANPFGVYGLYGGSVTKISGKMDDVFNNAIFPPNLVAVNPSAAVANVFSQKMFMLLITIQDPFTLTYRNALVCYDEKDWFIASQSVNLIYIGSQEINSSIAAWGTDGNSLFPLFNVASSTLSKKLSTKLYGAAAPYIMKQALGIYIQAQDTSGTDAGITFNTATVDNELTSYPMPNQIVINNSFAPLAPVFASETGDVVGVNLGVTLTSTSPDFEIFNLSLGYVDTVGLFGSTDLSGQNGE